MQNYTIVDKAALALGGGLTLLGIVVLGFIEILAGQPYGAAPMTNDAGGIVATPLVDPNLRVGLVILGLVVLLIWGGYRMIGTTTEDGATLDAEVAAD